MEGVCHFYFYFYFGDDDDEGDDVGDEEASYQDSKRT